MSDPAESYEQLAAHARETALLSSVQGILDWDEQTYLPPAGGAHRAEQLAYLAGLIHRRQTAAEVGAWLSELVDSPLAADRHGDTGAVIHQLRRQYDKKTKLPADLVEEMARTSSLAQQAWRDARAADDFAAFRPLLERTVELKQREAEAIGYTDSPYDALLDDYEPGESTANVARVLSELRAALTPLVQQIADSGFQPPSNLLRGDFPVEQQAALGRRAAEAIGFDFHAGRLDVTTHPFCGGGGPRDVRLTTRYDPRELAGGFFSILHEAGHGLYEQGLPAEWYGLPTGEAVSLGMHESQSRLWENLVGRSLAFWVWLLPEAQQAFPSALGGARVDDLYAAVNDSRPSLIRTESDEATYNLHIIIRFELEQALLTGELAVTDLPAAWNAKYREYLGIEPPSDADGVLQDVHWAAGLFGYFPTYTLGNLYASQLYEQAEADLGALAPRLERGDFGPLLGWLREKVHAAGQRFTAAELAQRVTGQPLGHAALMRHLNAKFGGLCGFG